MRPASPLALLLLLPGLAGAQTEAADMTRGNAARLALDPPAALAAYTAAIAVDSMNGTAYWKAALTLVDMGKLTPDSVPSPERDSLYSRAEVLAQRAVVLEPKSADAYFILATAIGRAALTKGTKERVRRAVEIQQDALTAIGLDQSHDGHTMCSVAGTPRSCGCRAWSDSWPSRSWAGACSARPAGAMQRCICSAR